MADQYEGALKRIVALAREWAEIVTRVAAAAETDRRLLWELERTITAASKEIRAPNERVLQRAEQERWRDRLRAAEPLHLAGRRDYPSATAFWSALFLGVTLLIVILVIRLLAS